MYADSGAAAHDSGIMPPTPPQTIPPPVQTRCPPPFRPNLPPATTDLHVARYYQLLHHDFSAYQAERGNATDPQRLADQLIVVFDGAIVQAVMGTGRRADAALTAVRTLLDAQYIP